MGFKILKNLLGDDIYIDPSSVSVIEQASLDEAASQPKTRLTFSSGQIRLVLGRPWEVANLLES